MSEPQSPDPVDDFDARLRRAQDSARPVPVQPDSMGATSMNGFGMAFRIGTELVAALAVGVGIGYLLDRWLGSGPWMMVLFFFLGSAAGVLNVYRATSGIGLAPGYRPRQDTPSGAKDDNESRG